jgi:hypothetical protein
MAPLKTLAEQTGSLAIEPHHFDEIAKPTIIPHTLRDPFGSTIHGTRFMDSGFPPTVVLGGMALMS